MIAWVDKNKDGIMQYNEGNVFLGKPVYDDEKRVESGPRPVSNELTDSPNEIYYDRDIIVLANPEMAGLPKWVIALVMAGCVAAALSTAAGLLLVLSTSVSHDLMKKILKPDISDQQKSGMLGLPPLELLPLPHTLGLIHPQALLPRQWPLPSDWQLPLLSHPNHGYFLEEDKQTGSHCRDDLRNWLHSQLHHSFSIPDRQQRLLVGYFSRGIGFLGNVYQFHHSFYS